MGIRWLAAAAHAGPGSITLWLLAAVLFFVPTALAVSTLTERWPDQGGIYVWTRRAFGPWHGFLCGWCYWLNNLFYLPGLILAGLSMAGVQFGLSERADVVIPASLVTLWIGIAASIVDLKIGKWVGNLGGMATYAAAGLLVVLGAIVWSRSGSATPLNPLPEWNLERLNFWSQIAFAFGGLELGAILCGEIRDPRRNVPRAAWIAGLGIASLYILGTVAMLVLRTPDRISPITGLVDAGADAAALLGAPWIAAALACAVLVGVAGQLSAWIGGVARIPFAIGVDRYLPASFARLHPRFGTPHVAVIWQGVACTVFVLAMQVGDNLRTAYQLLVDLGVVTYFIPFLYMFAAAWREGRRWSAAAGTFVTAASIVLSAIPPGGVSSMLLFEAKLIGGTALVVAAARLCFVRARSNG